MNPISFLLACLLLISLGHASPAGNKKRLLMRIIRHQPCTTKPAPNEAFRIAAIEKAPLINDEKRGEGCYLISGPVQVKRRIGGTVQTYVQARSGSKGPLEKCTGADNSNCGGFGSCVYCDFCSAVKQVEKTGSQISVEQGGKPLDCGGGIGQGNYTDIKVSFCMPTKEEFLDAEGIDEDIWNQGNDGGHTFFMTMYVFNKQISNMSPNDLQKIATDDSSEIIACHRLVGSVFENN